MIRPRHLKLLVAVALGACEGTEESLGPAATVLSDDGLRVALTIEPEVIDAPGTAVARLTYTNTGTEELVFTSTAGCLSFAAVYRREKRIPFPATEYACTAALTDWALQPRAELTMEWPLTVGGEDGVEVPAGTYRFVAMTNTGHGNLKATFVVR